MLHDLRYAVRMLLRKPGFAAAAVLILGLGIGVNVAVFSLVHGILLRPLPVRDPDRLVRIRETIAEEGGATQVDSLSPATWLKWRDQAQQTFEGIAASTGAELNLTGQERPERVDGAAISWNFFPVLGIEPVLGRNFRPEEDRPGADRVVLMGHALWQRRFGADPRVLGAVLTLNGLPHTVIGVMPPALRHPYEAEMWVPLALGDNPADAHAHYLYTPARLKPGVTMQQAEEDLAALARRLAPEYPSRAAPSGARLILLRDELVGGIRPLLYALLAAAGFVLVIACANLSGLLLARSLDQGREVAIRAALGASPGRLARLYLTQSLLLSMLGCAAGLLLALWSVGPFVSMSPIYREAIQEFDATARIDLAALGFSVLASLAVGALFGLVPALRAARSDPQSALKEQDRASTAGARGSRALGALVVAEFAVALVLLVGAGLLLRSFDRLRNTDRGFDPRGVLTFEVAFPQSRYPDIGRKAALLRGALERIRVLPGAVSAGATMVQPLFPGTWVASFSVEGRTAPDPPGYYLTHHRVITPDYFAALRIPLLQGRDFTEQDRDGGSPVVIVSRSIAERYWPGQDPVGKRVKMGMSSSQRPWMTVVGVVGTLRETPDENLTAPDAWYMPYTQSVGFPYETMTFVVRAQGDPRDLLGAASEAVWAVDRELAVYNVATMDELLRESLRQERFAVLLVGLFGLFGLLLAAAGVYGVVSYAAGRRTREIGIRMALGAQWRDVFRLVVGRSMLLALAGLAAGLGIALALTRVVRSLLFEISATDPLTFAGSALLLAAVAFVACAVPARRAARVDPLVALRYE